MTHLDKILVIPAWWQLHRFTDNDLYVEHW